MSLVVMPVYMCLSVCAEGGALWLTNTLLMLLVCCVAAMVLLNWLSLCCSNGFCHWPQVCAGWELLTLAAVWLAGI